MLMTISLGTAVAEDRRNIIYRLIHESEVPANQKTIGTLNLYRGKPNGNIE